jgi:hypothetical protein
MAASKDTEGHPIIPWLANYYRCFIKQYTDIAKPLVDLTKKDTPFVWGSTQYDAFETMK